MTSTPIKIPEETMNAIVNKAILDSLTPEVRENILAQAIAKLTQAPEKTTFGTPKNSPLQEAFEAACRAQVYTVVRQMVEDDPQVQQAIRDVVTPTIMTLAEGNYEGLPEKIGEAIGQWIQERGRR